MFESLLSYQHSLIFVFHFNSSVKTASGLLLAVFYICWIDVVVACDLCTVDTAV